MKQIVLCFLLLISLSSLAQKITRTPYLQKPTSSSITVRWKTDINSIGKVVFWKENSKTETEISENSPTSIHEVELKNLEPNTKYFYKVISDSKPLESYFKTFPSKSVNEPIRIWAMGDFGDFTKKEYIDNQNAVYASFKKNNQNKDIDLWMWLGDNAYCCGTDEQYQTGVFNYFDSDFFGKTPIVSIPGNHEYYFEKGSEATRKIPYFDLISVHSQAEGGGLPSNNKAYYSFDIGDIHFIALDSYGLDNGYKLYNWNSPQYQWLLQDLAHNATQNKKWTVVFVHHPPYTKRSHDSDVEQDLAELRRHLVHVFDEYKVDLVLSGHSHTYDRSYLIKGHRDDSKTFSHDIHTVQKTKALYTQDSPPIINKNEGTIYAVVGSSGRLDWNGKSEPHASSAYSNKDIGGSLLITLDDNRLRGEWMAADGNIKDSFTLFKNVNQNKTINLNYGEEVNLEASWTGNYIWSINNEKTKTLKHRFFENTEVSVRDSLGYLKDIYTINIKEKSVIKTELSKDIVLCEGGTVSGTLETQNFNIENPTFSVLLSDEKGSFKNAIELGKTKEKQFSFDLPENLNTEGTYQIKTEVLNHSYLESIATESFTILPKPSAEITNPGIVPYSAEISLNIKVSGSLPGILKISNLGEINITEAETTLKVHPKGGEKYQIESYKNTCGNAEKLEGIVSVENVLSTEKELFGIQIYPNPSFGKYEIKSPASKENPTKLMVIDALGRIVKTEILYQAKEVISLENFRSGIYTFRISQHQKSKALKVIKN